MAYLGRRDSGSRRVIAAVVTVVVIADLVLLPRLARDERREVDQLVRVAGLRG